jgi:hypothetical protein
VRRRIAAALLPLPRIAQPAKLHYEQKRSPFHSVPLGVVRDIWIMWRMQKERHVTLRVYGIARSRAIRTRWMADELGLTGELVEIGFGPDGTQSPSYLAINPNRRVPAIDDDGLILTESLAINLYLARKHGGSGQTVGVCSDDQLAVSRPRSYTTPAGTILSATDAARYTRAGDSWLARSLHRTQPKTSIDQSSMAIFAAEKCPCKW